MPICISYLVRPDFSEDSGRSNVRWLMQNIAGIRTLYLSVISPERLKTILYENSNSCSGVCDEISSSDLILRSLWYIVFIGDRFPPLCSKKILFQEAVGEKRQWLAQGSLWRTWKKQLEGTFTEVWIFQMPPTDVFGWVHHQVKPDMTCPHVMELIALKSWHQFARCRCGLAFCERHMAAENHECGSLTYPNLHHFRI